MASHAAGMTIATIRAYVAADEPSWLRCRALSFLDTCYYDDVWDRRRQEDDAVELVAADQDGAVLGLLDVSFAVDDGTLRATIDTVAVHPDHQRGGMAHALLEQSVAAVQARGAATLDAWTREDAPALAWYAAHGFTERFRYIHAYADWRDDLAALGRPGDGSRIAAAFLHAPVENELVMRQLYRRVYVCRQLLREMC